MGRVKRTERNKHQSFSYFGRRFLKVKRSSTPSLYPALSWNNSGGNLAAILSLKAVERKIPLLSQLLIVPVTDNTASIENLWKENQHTPWLTPVRMNWFKNNYLPNKEDWIKWDASPTFAPDELIVQTPKAWIAVCEMDILKNEGIAYGEKLKKVGVEVETVVYPGAPHPIMAMDGAYSSDLHCFQGLIIIAFEPLQGE